MLLLNMNGSPFAQNDSSTASVSDTIAFPSYAASPLNAAAYSCAQREW